MLSFPLHLLKTKKLLTFFLYLLFSILLLSLNFERQSLIKRKIIWLLYPFQRSISKIDKNLLNIKREELNLNNLKEENQKLSLKLSQFEAKRQIWKELTRENERFRALLNFKRKIPLELIPAQVIGRDASNWNKALFINKGEKEGIAQNFPVITSKGLVGQVIEVSPHQSKVMTILDTNIRVTGLIERNRIQGIICGTNNPWCCLNYISLRENVEKNDFVISSGQGGVFPKGLMIGKISSVKKRETELFQNIKVEPAVNFSQLEEVMVMIDR